MKKYKVIMGEWVSVHVNQIAIITTDKDITNMKAEEVAKLLDDDDNTQIDICKSDYDWSTEEHEDWDRYDENGFVLLEEVKEADNVSK